MWNYNKRNSAKFHRFPASPHAVFTFQTSSDVTSVWLTAFLPLLRGRRSGQVMTYFGSVWVGSPSGRKNWPTSATPAQRSASGCRGVSTFCAEQRRLPAGDLHQLNTLAGTYSAGRHTADGVSGSRRSRGRPSPVGFNCRGFRRVSARWPIAVRFVWPAAVGNSAQFCVAWLRGRLRAETTSVWSLLHVGVEFVNAVASRTAEGSFTRVSASDSLRPRRYIHLFAYLLTLLNTPNDERVWGQFSVADCVTVSFNPTDHLHLNNTGSIENRIILN